eukprot:TRINITY_DN30928_c0_g1_i1.p1 TRINITY_DN30928_c0_g1~~TRINITY_DN30928_c0_g1_i1.p1  ORF type:complete len:1169 (+),score=204.01 TRINITY_DN30928_c0_g1_i1:475-3507(+)
MFGDVEPLWVSVSCCNSVPSEDPTELPPVSNICENYCTGFHGDPFRPEQFMDSRPVPKMALFHIPHSVISSGTPLYLLVKVFRLLTGDDTTTITEMYSTTTTTSKAKKLVDKYKTKVSSQNWNCRTELGWTIVPLCGGGQGELANTRALCISSLRRSTAVSSREQCFDLYFDSQKQGQQEVAISMELSMERVDPSWLQPTSEVDAVRRCLVGGVLAIPCASVVTPAAVPSQQTRREIVVSLQGLSILKAKTSSGIDARTFMIEFSLKSDDRFGSTPLPNSFLDKDTTTLVSTQSSSISFHHRQALFDDDLIIFLPDSLPPKLHLFATIYHVSYKQGGSFLLKKDLFDTPLSIVGHAALPLCPEGSLIGGGYWDLKVLSQISEVSQRLQLQGGTYFEALSSAPDNQFCDGGGKVLSLLVRDCSTIHLPKSLSALIEHVHSVLYNNASLDLEFLSKAVAFTCTSENKNSLIRFFTVTMNYLLALLSFVAVQVDDDENVLLSEVFLKIAVVMNAVSSKDSSVVSWYCSSCFSNDLLSGYSRCVCWDALLDGFTSCLQHKSELAQQHLSYKSTYRHIFLLLLKSYLLHASDGSCVDLFTEGLVCAVDGAEVTPKKRKSVHFDFSVPDDDAGEKKLSRCGNDNPVPVQGIVNRKGCPGVEKLAASVSAGSKAIADLHSDLIIPGIHKAWGELLADLSSVAPKELICDSLKLLHNDTHEDTSIIQTIDALLAFLGRVADPASVQRATTDIVISLASKVLLDSNSSKQLRLCTYELIGITFSTFSTLSHSSDEADRQQEQLTKEMLSDLLPVLSQSWKTTIENITKEKEQMEGLMEAYKSQINSIKALVARLVYLEEGGENATKDLVADDEIDDVEIREDPEAIAQMIVLKQTALAELQSELFNLEAEERRECRIVSLLLLSIFNESNPSEYPFICPYLSSMTRLTQCYQSTPELLKNVSQHATQILCDILLNAPVTDEVIEACKSIKGSPNSLSTAVNCANSILQQRCGEHASEFE